MFSKNISVLLSAYNAEKTINTAIESILSQSYDNFEFLILDDASTDNTFKIIESFSREDKRIRIFKNSYNLGLTKSLNLLLNESNADLIARQDADDKSYKIRFQKQLEYLTVNKLDFVYARSIRNDNNKTIPKYSFYLPKKIILKYKNPFIHGTLFGRKEALNSINGYDENFLYAQDYKLVTDLMSKSFKIKIMKDVLYESNFTNNITTLNQKEQEFYSDCVKKKIKPSEFLK